MDNEIRDAVARAGITQREVADLLRVTLLTAHKYISGKPINSGRLARVKLVTHVLNALVDSGKLPLKHTNRGEGKEKRVAALVKLQKHIDYLLRG